MKLQDHNDSKEVFNVITKDQEGKERKCPQCVFCGTYKKVSYLKEIEDMVCEECKKEILK